MDKKEKRYILLPLILCAAMGLRSVVAARSAAIELDGIGYATMAGRFARRLLGRALESVSPLVAFYEKGTWVNLAPETVNDRSIPHFLRTAAEEKIKYVVPDEEAEKLLPDLAGYLSKSVPPREFGEKGAFVRIYRLDST